MLDNPFSTTALHLLVRDIIKAKTFAIEAEVNGRNTGDTWTVTRTATTDSYRSPHSITSVLGALKHWEKGAVLFQPYLIAEGTNEEIASELMDEFDRGLRSAAWVRIGTIKLETVDSRQTVLTVAITEPEIAALFKLKYPLA
ncbi:hypothetical protein KX729_09220 [Rhizobium sp. XQZ8]|uniref:hypothetical protein n=1 Tax=Rhizobium populisoli TaxID=2859785 RepID=UPI001CA598AE|nr:hypothetical protein [Rhizobium populisoli]MBW6421619.1 hypothetical protein [Rhizobium populisoli]